MYASIRTYRIDRGSMTDVMRRIDRDFAEAISQEAGFIAYECIDIGGDKLCTVSTFEDRAQADASNELAARWVAEELADFRIERMGVIAGQVAVSRAGAAMLEPAHH